jgi:2-succinyl-5-enolpyruvyl-6-hydroxy-3-cyclohexene-1-carboxylate synthase
VVEAHHAGVPLLVCTADRPPELRDVGAPQAIDQTHLYGRSVRWFFDPGPADEAMRSSWRSIGARAVVAAHDGPVHLNLPFREPLAAAPGELPPGRAGGEPWHRLEPASASEVVPIAGRRPVLVAGSRVPPELTSGSWPLLAGLGATGAGPSVVAHADALLRVAELREELAPDAVIRIGTPPASRVVNEWLAASGAREATLGRGWVDPGRTASLVGGLLQPEVLVAPEGGWLDRWLALDAAADDAIAAVLADHPEPTEPGTARTVVAALPDGAQLVVSSSMPVRDLEWYACPRSGITVHANRGANGIDGVLSTAIGVALASGAPTACLLGDVAFLHDSNALIGIADRGIDLTVVVVDNDGSGIFSFLPQAATLPAERFECLFGTPHGVRPELLAAAHGLVSLTVEAADSLALAVEASVRAGGARLVVARTDRAANVKLHDELHAAVRRAVLQVTG